jgi:hypothetical protein
MEEGLIHRDVPLVADDQPAEVGDPGDAPLHFPSTLIPSQFAPVLRWRLAAVGLVRTDQLDATPLQTLSQRIGVGGAIVDQPPGIFARPAATAGHRHALQRRFDQCRFVRGCRGQLNSQRNTLAACHHHPLCTLAAFGFSDAGAPFFAGAKEPSAKVSSQSSWPRSSSSPRNFRQSVSQTSCASQSRSRRQQVLGEGYCAGRSFQRAPDRKTQRMPSKHRRSSTRRRPPAGDRLALGNSFSILDHCSSVSSESCRDMKRTPFHVTFNHKVIHRANLSLGKF